MNLENFPQSAMGQRLLGSVTHGWYDRSYVGKWLYEIMGISLEQVTEIYENLPWQFFVETATWGLAYYEQKYGLPIRPKLTYDQRRRIILNHLKSRVAITPYHMESLIARQTGWTAEVMDVHRPGSIGYKPLHPNCFLIVIWERDTNSIVDFQLIETLIQRVKQSHTVFTIEHRQLLNESADLCVGAQHTMLVHYDIKPRKIGRDIEQTVSINAATGMNCMILEEIMAERR